MRVNTLIDRLGFNRQNGLHFFSELTWKNKFSRRVEEIIEEKLQPYAIYEFNNDPFIMFFETPQKPEIHKWLWNINSSPVIVIDEGNQIKVYNGFAFNSKEKLLHLLVKEEKKIFEFDYINLVSGKFLAKYSGNFRDTNRVDYKLLENIKTARDILIDEYSLSPFVVNSLIGRILFSRYLIDRNVKIGKYGYLNRPGLLKILENREGTYHLFSYLRTKFNGNLFPIDPENEASVKAKPHLEVLTNLLKGHELKTGQMNLFEFYDFSVLPVEFISSIYEFFLGEENQRKQGAYYTPPFLVDYILKETVDVYFERNPGDFQCKVLDPSCGSGIFLVETLRRFIRRYIELNPGCMNDRKKFKERLKSLLCDNLFGIDKDENAINVAIFSLYITLLDYQDPKDIEDFKFPLLEGSNFFHKDFFNTGSNFNTILQGKKLDFIIGNPPWGNPSKEEGNSKYIDYCRRKGVNIGRKEISQAFLIRVGDFSGCSTNCSLIVTSKNLYNINTGSKKFREYFLNNFKVNHILELSSVRREVFNKSNSSSIAPPSIIFYQNANDHSTDTNVVRHISLKPNRFFNLFKIFIIEKYDYKEVQQKYFKKHDWLFKVLVYGNILDFYFIKRLKENYPTINESILKNSSDFSKGQGIMVGGGDKNDVSYLLNEPYIETRRDLKPFFVNIEYGDTWQTRFVHRPRDKKLFNGNSMIMAEGLLSDLSSKAAYLSRKAVFKSSITAIHAKRSRDKELLKILVGLLNSSLFSYFIMTTGSSAAIEREQTHDDEKFDFCFFNNIKIAEVVEKIEQNREDYFCVSAEMNRKILNPALKRSKKKIEEEFYVLKRDLNNIIYKTFKLSNREKVLVEYVRDVSIPLFNRQNIKKLFDKVPENILEEYAQLYISHFKKYFQGPNEYFSAEIYMTEYIVGINFVVRDTKPENSLRWIRGHDVPEVVELLSHMSFSEISNKIFIQKDIKGFEKNSFYVIKPNQHRLWHKAIAYLDLNEFSDAILRSGKEQLPE